ncbi:MAG: hypothetical protein KAG66_13930, partial [Methylococcales bacterium]|nr:hypothetical protein [Methylococcales bacterium]
MQNQNPEAWEDFFSRIAPAWGLDTFEKLVQHFRPMTYDIFCDPMRFGWSAEEDLAYFRFWWGDRYEPENYHFMGEKRNHPYDAATVCCEVSIGIRMTLRGLRHHTCRYVHLYDYWKNAVLLLDENIFYPKSNYHHDCFRSVDERTKERLRKAKCRVASMLEKINKKEEVIKKFNDDRGKKNGDELSLRPYGMEDLDGDAFWALPELVSLRQQITDDIDNGTLPASIKALNHWASSPASDNTQLNWSTELGVKYKDPWKPAVRKKRKTTSKAKPRPAPKVQIADAELNSICRKLADYRSALIDLGVTVKAEVVQDMTGIDALLKKAKLKGQDATDYLKALSVQNDKLDFYELLIPEYYFGIWREPFDGYEESEVNTVYREIWKQVATATADHCTMEKMRTRKEKF